MADKPHWTQEFLVRQVERARTEMQRDARDLDTAKDELEATIHELRPRATVEFTEYELAWLTEQLHQNHPCLLPGSTGWSALAKLDQALAIESAPDGRFTPRDGAA